MLKATVIPSVGATPIEACGGTVVVCDQFDNPLVVVMMVADRTSLIATHRDSDFNRILSALGIDRVVVDDTIRLDSPPAGAELLLDPTKRGRLITGAKR